MDGITFRYLISLAVHEKLNMHLMDVLPLTYMDRLILIFT
ncbi:unnamed protein product [Rhodiola kirilowii]